MIRLFVGALACAFAGVAYGAEEAPHWQALAVDVFDTVLFGLLGIALLIGGYKAFAASVPWDLNHEIEKDDNVAVAIVVGSLFIGISIIVAAVLTT